MSETNETLPQTAAAPSGAKTGKLSFMEKCAVGTGGMAVSLGNQSVRTTGMAVLNMILKINALWVGLVIALPFLWDAVIDPIMGGISDKFRSRYGRRRPFILLGAPLMFITFIAIWMIPLEWNDAGKLAWFIVTSLLFYMAYSIFSVPYISMTYEMSPDYNERTSVQGYVTFWNRVGELTYMGLIPLSVALIAWKYGYADTNNLTTQEKIEGIRMSACIYGLIGMCIFGALPAIFGRERCYELNIKESRGKEYRFWSTVHDTLRNKSCALLCFLSVCTIIAGVSASTMDWYLLIYYLSNGNIQLGTQWKLVVTIGYASVGIVGIPLIVWLTGKLSKIQGLRFIYSLMILNAILRWFIYRPGRFEVGLSWSSFPEIGASLVAILNSLIWLDPLTGGMFWIGVGVLMQSMIADICDQDELENGQRREGMFGAIFGWATKASFAISFVLSGIFLNLISFDPDLETQSPGTYLGMRLAMVLGAALPAILCFLLLGFYPLTKEKTKENRRILEARRGTV